MTGSPAPVDEFRFLAGRSPVQEFVRFIKTHALNGQAIEDSVLIREWNAFNVCVRDLETIDAGCADVTELVSVPDAAVHSAGADISDILTHQCLGDLPHSWSLVDLDRLMVWQKYVNCGFAAKLRSNFPANPTVEELLRLSSGRLDVPPPCRVTMLSGNNFVFSSVSTDLQVLNTVPLNPECLGGFRPFGRPQSVVAVVVGYGINHMMAVHMGERLLLINGTHRAYAMRTHGIRYAPCVVVRATRTEELDLLGMPISNEQVEGYFRVRRPTLLRDYFDQRLYKSFLVPRSDQLVQLELRFSQSRVQQSQ
jgi:hypothetical protein